MEKEKINKKVRKKLFYILKIIWFALGGFFLLISSLMDLLIRMPGNWAVEVYWILLGASYPLLGLWGIITSLFILFRFIIRKCKKKGLREERLIQKKAKKQLFYILKMIWYIFGVLLLFLFSIFFAWGWFVNDFTKVLMLRLLFESSFYGLGIWGSFTLIFLLIKWIYKKWIKKK